MQAIIIITVSIHAALVLTIVHGAVGVGDEDAAGQPVVEGRVRAAGLQDSKWEGQREGFAVQTVEMAVLGQ